MSVMGSQITSLTIVYSTVYSGVDQRKHRLLWEEFTGDRWIPLTQRASNAENVSIWWRHRDIHVDYRHGILNKDFLLKYAINFMQQQDFDDHVINGVWVLIWRMCIGMYLYHHKYINIENML